MAAITLIVNGAKMTAEAAPGETLLSVLRNRLGLTGTKYGCGEGQCGACTVLFNGRPIRSCRAPAESAQGMHILTIEGLAGEGALSPVQRAFLEEEAFQCGYCTPGMIMAAHALLASNAKPTDAEIIQHMNGNICRCGTYPRIVAAIHRAAQSGTDDLKAVLDEMNKNAAAFRSVQANFVFDQYTAVVRETDTQWGEMFLRRTHGGMDAALRIDKPEPKQVVFLQKDCKLRFYQPRINQVTERDACSNRSDIDTYMSLGFGASGDDLLKSFDVKMVGWETINGVKTAKLELVAKDPKVRNMFSKFVLWIDPARDISLKQQFFEPSGDYRLASYTNVRLNSKIPDDAFQLKTNSGTKVVSQ